MNGLAASARKQLLLYGVLSAAVLIGLTAAAVAGFPELTDKGLTVYITAVPIFFTVLAFYLGYRDVAEEGLSDSEIEGTARRAKIFGGVMFLLSVTAVALIAALANS